MKTITSKMQLNNILRETEINRPYSDEDNNIIVKCIDSNIKELKEINPLPKHLKPNKRDMDKRESSSIRFTLNKGFTIKDLLQGPGRDQFKRINEDQVILGRGDSNKGFINVIDEEKDLYKDKAYSILIPNQINGKRINLLELDSIEDIRTDLPGKETMGDIDNRHLNIIYTEDYIEQLNNYTSEMKDIIKNDKKGQLRDKHREYLKKEYYLVFELSSKVSSEYYIDYRNKDVVIRKL